MCDCRDPVPSVLQKKKKPCRIKTTTNRVIRPTLFFTLTEPLLAYAKMLRQAYISVGATIRSAIRFRCGPTHTTTSALYHLYVTILRPRRVVKTRLTLAARERYEWRSAIFRVCIGSCAALITASAVVSGRCTGLLLCAARSSVYGALLELAGGLLQRRRNR